MGSILLAFALMFQAGFATVSRTSSPQINVVGAWSGGPLPAGIGPFETIHSTVTFRTDGTYTLSVAKPTGTFGGSGTYSIVGDTLTLNSTLGAPSVNSYRVSRQGATLTLQLVGQETNPLTLTPQTGSTP